MGTVIIMADRTTMKDMARNVQVIIYILDFNVYYTTGIFIE